MKILNTTTGKIEELTYAPNGCDGLQDLVAGDATIRWNAKRDCRQADQSSIDWWKKWISQQGELDALTSAVREDFDAEAVEEILAAVNEAQDCDLEDQPKAGKAALAAWMRDNDYTIKRFPDGSIGFPRL